MPSVLNCSLSDSIRIDYIDMQILIRIHGNGPTIFNLTDFYADMDIQIWIRAYGTAALYMIKTNIDEPVTFLIYDEY